MRDVRIQRLLLCMFQVHVVATAIIAIFFAIGWTYRSTKGIGLISPSELGTALLLLTTFLFVHGSRLTTYIEKCGQFTLPMLEFVISALVAIAFVAIAVWMFYDISFLQNLQPDNGDACNCDRTFLNQTFNAFLFLAFVIALVEVYIELRVRFIASSTTPPVP